jgi:hypothetical protein
LEEQYPIYSNGGTPFIQNKQLIKILGGKQLIYLNQLSSTQKSAIWDRFNNAMLPGIFTFSIALTHHST